MSFFVYSEPPSDEKNYRGNVSQPFGGGMSVVNVDFYDDLMSVQLHDDATVSNLQALLYEQTFVPPSMQGLYTCVGGSAMKLRDSSESIEMVPGSNFTLVMEPDQPACF